MNPYQHEPDHSGVAWDEGRESMRAAFDAVVAERDEAVRQREQAATSRNVIAQERDLAIDRLDAVSRERDAALAALREADELLRRVDPFTGTFAMGADSEDLWRADVAAWRALPGCCDRPVPEKGEANE